MSYKLWIEADRGLPDPVPLAEPVPLARPSPAVRRLLEELHGRQGRDAAGLLERALPRLDPDARATLRPVLGWCRGWPTAYLQVWAVSEQPVLA